MSNQKLKVQTVHGCIDADKISHFQPHEHIMLEKGRAFECNKDLCIDDLARSIEELKRLPKQTALTDAQPLGAGRMAKELAIVSGRANVHIIASTGFHKNMFYWKNHWIHEKTSEELANVFITELQEGMYVGNGSDFPKTKVNHKAGQIKTAVDKAGMTEDTKRKFKAAAIASEETGASIMVHIEKGSTPEEVVAFLVHHHVSPHHIILCHLDRTHHDYERHVRLAKTGVFLEYDTIGRFKYHDDETEARLITYMLESGFSDSILLSLDTTRARLKSYNGEIGMDYLVTDFLPLLIQHGVSKETIRQLTVLNPMKAMSMSK